MAKNLNNTNNYPSVESNLDTNPNSEKSNPDKPSLMATLNKLIVTFCVTFIVSFVLMNVNASRHRERAPTTPDYNNYNFGTPNLMDDMDRYELLEQNRHNKYKLVQLLNKSEGIEHYLLEYKGQEVSYPIPQSKNPIMKKLVLTIEHHAPTQLRIKITDPTATRWEIPDRYPFPHFSGKIAEPSEKDSEYKIVIQEDPFGFAIVRRATEEVIFDTRSFPLMYSDLLIDVTSIIPTEHLFGLGERSSRFKMGPTGTYTIWARDKPEVIDYGMPGGHVYGQYPVYLMKEKSKNWHTVFFRSSNAMDVSMKDGQSVRYRVAGGIIDLVFFLGDKNPESPIEQYHEYVGNWTTLPFWSMGYHQSRWGYTNLQIVKEKIQKFREIEIPVDVIWSDLDYMIDKEDFTINAQRFPIKEFNDWLRDEKLHWVPIIDAGVSRKFRHEVGYAEGIKRDIFVKNNRGEPLVGSVWPGESHFVDWFHPAAEKYWSDMLERLYVHVKFSGIWLDMNEPTNFINGEVGREWEYSRYDLLPYTPGHQPLKTMTISLDAKHYGGIEEFNVHGLTGMLSCKATYLYLKQKTPMPFVLTRSSAFGTGQFSNKWTGDNGANWDFMKYGTTGIFQFGIYGLPFTGADLCGFMRSTNAELCARWYQAGALYPFTRNHNHLEARDQEPYSFYEGYVTVAAAKAIQLRYSIIKWYYAQFIEKRGKGLVFRPMLFEFPDEEILYSLDVWYTDLQFMLGKSLLAVPVYQPRKDIVTAYFPPATWFNFYTGELMHNDLAKGSTREIRAPLTDYIPLFIRGGTIVHRQNVKGVKRTGDLDNKFELIVAFNKTASDEEAYEAKGFIIGLTNLTDESVHEKCIIDNCLLDIVATAQKESSNSLAIAFKFTARNQANDGLEAQLISSIKMYGLLDGYKESELAGFYRVHSGEEGSGQPTRTRFAYKHNKSLTFADSEISIKDGVSLEILIEFGAGSEF